MSCQKHQTSTVGPAPEIVAPSAPSSRRLGDDSHRARVERLAVRLVEAVGEAAADQGQVGALDPERELGRGGDVVDRGAERDLGRAARRAPPRSATSSAGITRIASTPSGGSSRTGAGSPSRLGRGQATKPP